jgi:protein gp37
MNCYAETQNKMYGRSVWGNGVPRQRSSEAYRKKPFKWNDEAKAAGKRIKVFPSWCDPFDTEVPLEWRTDMWATINRTPYLIYLLLTKRARELDQYDSFPTNVWLGVTVENMEMAHERIPHLLNAKASVRFISAEPMLEKLDLSEYLKVHEEPPYPGRRKIGWVICGAESGARRRPFVIPWAIDLLKQCRNELIPFFMKQDSADGPGEQGRIPINLWNVKEVPDA